ncbi:hypothetical protein FQA39_LY12748 [Lamprigera yunnana]|nr:hypothetical protein FQA39_LY12748 [Lamprigera yunnana]
MFTLISRVQKYLESNVYKAYVDIDVMTDELQKPEPSFISPGLKKKPLHGTPGCGKMLLANAIAGELGIPLLQVAGPELVGGRSDRIRNLFDRALNSAPCVLFIDEDKRQLEKALALPKASQQLLKKQTWETSTKSQEADQQINGENTIVVIEDDLKPEMTINVLNKEDTEQFLKALHLLQPLQTVLEGLISWLHEEATLSNDQLFTLFIDMNDFSMALKVVQLFAKGKNFATVPDVT